MRTVFTGEDWMRKNCVNSKTAELGEIFEEFSKSFWNTKNQSIRTNSQSKLRFFSRQFPEAHARSNISENVSGLDEDLRFQINLIVTLKKPQKRWVSALEAWFLPRESRSQYTWQQWIGLISSRCSLQCYGQQTIPKSNGPTGQNPMDYVIPEIELDKELFEQYHKR